MISFFRNNSIKLLIFLQSISVAQDFVDILAIGVIHSPSNNQSNVTKKINITESFTNLRIPLVLKNKDIVILGANFSSLSFHNHYNPVFSNAYYTNTLPIGYTKKWSEKFQTTLLALPKFSTDYKDVSSHDFQMGGVLLFTYTKKENLKYKFGTYYNQEFYGPLVLPLIGIDWQPNKKWSVFGNLPISLTVNRKLNSNFSTGFYFQAINMSYRLGEKFQNQYLQKYSLDFSLFLDSYLTKNIVLTFKAGHSLGRTFEFYNSNEKLKFRSMFVSIGDRPLPLNNAIKDGILLELRLSYRVSIKKDKTEEKTAE